MIIMCWLDRAAPRGRLRGRVGGIGWRDCIAWRESKQEETGQTPGQGRPTRYERGNYVLYLLMCYFFVSIVQYLHHNVDKIAWMFVFFFHLQAEEREREEKKERQEREAEEKKQKEEKEVRKINVLTWFKIKNSGAVKSFHTFLSIVIKLATNTNSI